MPQRHVVTPTPRTGSSKAKRTLSLTSREDLLSPPMQPVLEEAIRPKAAAAAWLEARVAGAEMSSSPDSSTRGSSGYGVGAEMVHLTMLSSGD
eukprot:2913745-Prymnesium_polylepis.1